jgi:hypothetical protein
MTGPARPASHETPERLLSIRELAEYRACPSPPSTAGATPTTGRSATASDVTSATGSATSNAGSRDDVTSAPARERSYWVGKRVGGAAGDNARSAPGVAF